MLKKKFFYHQEVEKYSKIVSEASKQKEEAAQREQAAAQREKKADNQIRVLKNVQAQTQVVAQKATMAQQHLEEQKRLDKQAAMMSTEAEKMRQEGERLMMVSALARLVFPHFSTKNPDTRKAEIDQARQHVERFNDRILSSRGQWMTVVNKNCPHLTEGAIKEIVIPVISAIPSDKISLDFGGFKDEIDMDPTVKFAISTSKVTQISFGELSSDQIKTLARGVASCVKAANPDFIKFSHEASGAKFNEEMKMLNAVTASSTHTHKSKPLPAIPPKPSRIIAPMDIPASSNVPAHLVPDRGSPPKGQA